MKPGDRPKGYGGGNSKAKDIAFLAATAPVWVPAWAAYAIVGRIGEALDGKGNPPGSRRR